MVVAEVYAVAYRVHFGEDKAELLADKNLTIVHEICGFRINGFCFNGYLHCYLAFNVGNDFLVFVIAEIVLFVRLGLNAYYCSDYFFLDGVLHALTCLY